MLWEFLLPPSQMGDPARQIVDAFDCRINFRDGTTALCLTSGLWNVNFGYGNPTVAAEIEPVVRRMNYAPLFRYGHNNARRAAEELLNRIGWTDGAVVFSTSGSALNDAIVKLARQWNQLNGRAARTIVTLSGSYHGMTLTSMQLSGEELGQNVYGARSPQFIHLPADDPSVWQTFFDERGASVALVLLEPVLGSGAIPLDEAVLETIMAAREQYGFLIAADEVATGYYRLGAIASSLRWKRRPDIIGLSKGLTNGTAASAALAMSSKILETFIEHDSIFVHGETQAGSPLATAAILGVLKFIDSIDIASVYKELEGHVDRDLSTLAQRHGWSTRGVGLFRYLGWPNFCDSDSELTKHTVDHFRTYGCVVQPSIGGVQIMPQVTMGSAQWTEAAEHLNDALTAWPNICPKVK